jgi:hypothetical protein
MRTAAQLEVHALSTGAYQVTVDWDIRYGASVYRRSRFSGILVQYTLLPR